MGGAFFADFIGLAFTFALLSDFLRGERALGTAAERVGKLALSFSYGTRTSIYINIFPSYAVIGVCVKSAVCLVVSMV